MLIDNELNKGLNLDYNPITIPSGYLTNCLNGTIKTNNGNEGILLNDMGNTKVGTAYLPAGYVPVGMKEYGGIVYVASKNPFTGKCLIGSFPSPGQLLNSGDGENGLSATVNIGDFINKDTLELTKTRIIQRLSETLNVGDGYKILYSTGTNQDTKNFPCYVNYSNDVNYPNETILDTKDGCFLELNIGVKGKSNNIVKLEDVKDDFNYILNNSGELYLILEVLLPQEFDVWYPKPTHDSTNGFEIKFHCMIDGVEVGENDVDVEVTTSTTSTTWYPQTNTETTTGTTTETTTDTTTSTSTYYSVITTNNVCDITFTPKKNGIKIPQLKQTFSIDLELAMTGTPNKEKWTTKYDSLRKSVKINYGFSGAFDVKSVTFEFYSLDKSDNSFNTTPYHTVSITGKKSFNGYFTKNITDLDLIENTLYLTRIICYDSTDTESGLFWDWTWTTDYVKYLSDIYTIPIQVKVTGNCTLEEGSILENIDPNNSSKDSTNDSDTIYKYKTTYSKTITVNLEAIEPEYVKIDSIPIKLPDLSTDVFSDTRSIESEKTSTNPSYYSIGGQTFTKETNPSTVTPDNVAGTVTLSAVYEFLAMSKPIPSQTSGHRIIKYNNGSSDRDFIYGKDQNTFQKYGLAIGAGMYHQAVGAEHIWTRIDFNEWDTKGDRSEVNIIVDSNVKYKNKGNAQRSWKDGCDAPLKQYYQQKVGFYPPISFLIGSTAGAYNVDLKKTSDLYEGTSGSRKGKDYSIVLWKDVSDNYLIVRTTYKKMHAYDALNNLFSSLYVSDVDESVSDNENVYAPDNNRYEYTASNVVSAKIKVNRDILFANTENTENTEYTYVLEQRIAEKVDEIHSGANTAIAAILTPATTQDDTNEDTTTETTTGTTTTNPYNLPTISFELGTLVVEGSLFVETKTLDAQDISDEVIKYLNQTFDLNNYNVYYYLDDSGAIQLKDVKGNSFNSQTIYYKTSNGKLTPLSDSSSLSGSELYNNTAITTTILNSLNKYFTISKIENSSKISKNCIVLNNTAQRKSSPDSDLIFSVPYIGECDNSNKWDETYTYPFTLSGKNNYKYLCDLVLPGSNSFNLY